MRLLHVFRTGFLKDSTSSSLTPKIMDFLAPAFPALSSLGPSSVDGGYKYAFIGEPAATHHSRALIPPLQREHGRNCPSSSPAANSIASCHSSRNNRGIFVYRTHSILCTTRINRRSRSWKCRNLRRPPTRHTQGPYANAPKDIICIGVDTDVSFSIWQCLERSRCTSCNGGSAECSNFLYVWSKFGTVEFPF